MAEPYFGSGLASGSARGSTETGDFYDRRGANNTDIFLDGIISHSNTTGWMLGEDVNAVVVIAIHVVWEYGGTVLIAPKAKSP